MCAAVGIDTDYPTTTRCRNNALELAVDDDCDRFTDGDRCIARAQPNEYCVVRATVEACVELDRAVTHAKPLTFRQSFNNIMVDVFYTACYSYTRCRRSSVAEQLFCKQQVTSSTLVAGSMSIQSSDWIVFLCLFRAKTAAPQRTGPASTAHQRFDTRRANRPVGKHRIVDGGNGECTRAGWVAEHVFSHAAATNDGMSIRHRGEYAARWRLIRWPQRPSPGS